MIDIHSHLVPNIDDGSQSLEETRKMLIHAIDEGITDIICTPHYMKFGNYHTNYNETETRFMKLKDDVKDLNINLYLGNELFYSEGLIDYIENKVVHTLNNSKYLLFEFSFQKYPEDTIFEDIYNLTVEGYVPVLAHPERYPFVQNNPTIIMDLIDEGCLIQSNQTSLLGLHGKKAQQTVDLLLKHNLVHFVASDGHNLNRPVQLKDGFNYVKNNYSQLLANQLFIENPRIILNNEDFEIPEYTKIKKTLFGYK